mgnify:CR=1 FL=1
MPCIKPIHAVQVGDDIKFGMNNQIIYGQNHRTFTIPCSNCIQCRLDISNQWAIRCYHESKLHNRNCFLTLTYKEDPISLNKVDIKIFLKKLQRRYPKQVRYFQVGEYGGKFGRPHHHCLIFGINHFDFNDIKRGKTTDSGGKVYLSKTLDQMWTHGQTNIGELNEKSIRYVTGYVLKKVTGKKQKAHYNGKLPEYITMSRKPGIGRLWYEKWKNDIYSRDDFTINGTKHIPPRYYDKQYSIDNPEHMDIIKESRIQKALSKITFDYKNEVKTSGIKLAKRKLLDQYDQFLDRKRGILVREKKLQLKIEEKERHNNAIRNCISV